jgi:hypothetical protein
MPPEDPAIMKKRLVKLFHNDLFLFLLNGVIAYTAFTTVILATLGVPPEAILDSGLQEVHLVFEG